MILSVLVFGGLQGLHIPAGSFLDWVVGIASFAWLLVIVTVPWNIYFEAKEAYSDANLSAERGIRIDERQVNSDLQISAGYFELLIFTRSF